MRVGKPTVIDFVYLSSFLWPGYSMLATDDATYEIRQEGMRSRQCQRDYGDSRANDVSFLCGY